MKSALIIGILALASGTLSAETLISIPGHRAEMKCEINEETGEVILGINLKGHIEQPKLIKTSWAKTPIGSETWKDPTYFRRSCEKIKQELTSRKTIEGTIWVSKEGHCDCRTQYECTFVTNQSLTFSPLRANGKQYHSFQAYGRMETEDEVCEGGGL